MSRTRDTTDWVGAVASIFGSSTAEKMVWRNPDRMVEALRPFSGINHALLPTGGGMHGDGFELSEEPGCIEMQVSPRAVYLFKPAMLVFEAIEGHPGESYFLMHLDGLEPTGVYESHRRGVEDLLDLGGGEYVSRVHWDEGHLGYDEDNYEIPIPGHARLVSRFHGGRVMLVAQQSLYNSLPETYDGRHSTMTPEQLRAFVESLLP